MKKIVLLVIIFFTLLLVGCSGTGTSTNDRFYTVPISSMTTTELLNRIDFCQLEAERAPIYLSMISWSNMAILYENELIRRGENK